MKNLKKKWEQELDMRLPELRKKVLDEPIPEKTAVALVKKRKKLLFKYISIASSIAAVLVICFSIIPVLMIQDSNPPVSDGSLGDTTSSTTPTVPSGNSTPSSNVTTPSTNVAPPNDDKEPPAQNEPKNAVLTVEINPRVMFISNKEGIVTSVIATNADADVLLSCDGFDESVIGKKISQALVNYVELATQLGYIDVDRAENTVTITSGKSESEIGALAEAKQSLEEHFTSKGVKAVVVDKTATVDELCKINELDVAEKIEDVIGKFADKSPLFSQRKFEELEGEELEGYYKETIINGVKDDVVNALEELSLILEIAKLDTKIIEMCLFDYWIVKDYESIEPSLQEIVLAMEEKLSLLEQKYGNKIENGIKLYGVAFQVSDNYINELKETIDAFERTEDYKYILGVLEKDASRLDRLENIPQSKEEIMKEHENSLKAEGNNRLEGNKQKQKTDKEDGEGFLDKDNTEMEEGLTQGEGKPPLPPQGDTKENLEKN